MSRIFITVTAFLAASVFSVPEIQAQQQQRKNLLQMLFPKAHERQLKRFREQHEAEQARLKAERLKQAAKKKPKIPANRYYAYRPHKWATIAITPLAIEYTSVGSIGEQSDIPTASDVPEQPKVPVPDTSDMTLDLSEFGSPELQAEKHLADAVSEFYSENQRYFWLNGQGNWNARARSVFKVLASADKYGLEPADYKFETLDGVASGQGRLIRELNLSIVALRYAMDADFGTINPNRLSSYHDFPVHDKKALEKFKQVMLKGLPARNLVALQPDSEAFNALKAELAEVSVESADTIDIPVRVFIRPGQSHDAIPAILEAIQRRGSEQLRAKHAGFFSNYSGAILYSPEAVEVVRSYQVESGLLPDGIIGPNTAGHIAGKKTANKAKRVKLAMERLRWLPDDLGPRHVFINQPEYRARYLEDGREKLSMRVVVGKKSNQTNFFYDEIEHVVYNPYWGVPPSIIVNEFRPKSLADPSYLDRLGYEVSTFGGKRLSSASINWLELEGKPNFMVRQPPGKKNALGELKIMFPNKHYIYMHDTPSRHLFKRKQRAFSHGCVRLHDPHAMAAAVLGRSKGHVKANIATGKNTTEKLRSKVPVYVSYFTAWPQADGSIGYFADIYGRDAHLAKAMEVTRKKRASAQAI